MAFYPLNTFAADDIKELELIVPTGAMVELNQKPKENGHYVPFILKEPESKQIDVDGKDIYKYEIPKNIINSCHYRISKDGYLTVAGWLQNIRWNSKEFTLEPLDINKRNSYSDCPFIYDDGMLLNITAGAPMDLNATGSFFLELKKGEEFRLKSYRTWQIIDSDAGNYFIEPDWHYEIMEHDGDEASVSIDEKGLIQAKREGISVIKITYDPIGIYQGENYVYYNATDPIHTGIVVVNVTDNKSALGTGIHTTEFDTIYSLKDSGIKPKISFKPENGASVRVQKPYQTDWNSGWIEYTPDTGGEYTVELDFGKNIVEVKKGSEVKYHVIRAAEIAYKVENKYRPNYPLMVGDVAKITFDGLYMPLPKLAAVYNPGYNYMGEPLVRLEYLRDGNVVSGKGDQYGLRSTNQILMELDEAGEYELTNGYVYLCYMGGGNNCTHLNIPESGIGADFRATLHGPFKFDALPDVKFQVAEKGSYEFSEAQMRDYCKLRSMKNISKDILLINRIGANQGIIEGERLVKNNLVSIQRNNLASQGYEPIIEFMPLNENVRLIWRYWNEGENEFVVTSSAVQPATFRTLDKKFALNKELNAELIVTNDNVTNETYAFKCVAGGIKKKTEKKLSNLPYFSDVRIVESKSGEVIQNNKGVFQAESITYSGINGDVETLSFGYGFVMLEKNHFASVPFDIEDIKLDMDWLDSVHDKTTVEITAGGIFKTIKGQTGVNNIKTEAISLNYGENVIECIIKDNEFNREMSYNFTIVRSQPPGSVKITSETEGVSITVKDSKNKTVQAAADGTYSLEAGKYKYIAQKTGYITKADEFTVTSESNQTVQIPKLTPLHLVGTNDCVNVTVQTDKTVAVNNVSINIKSEPAELDLVTGKKYVEYNAGGYTALHAIIEALGTGMQPIDFNCRKGKLKPLLELGDYSQKAGYVCEVNGKYIKEPAYHIVKNGDYVEYYFNPAYDGMIHASFEQQMIATTVGNSATVKLLGHEVYSENVAEPLSGIEILDNAKVIGTTDTKGELVIKNITEGTHAVTARKLDSSGNDLLTYNMCTIKAKAVSEEPVIAGKTTVKFRLIGDSKHGKSEHEKYVTWIATKRMTFDGESVSVYDVFTKALDDAGLEYVGAEKNYVSKIKAPKAYGGYWLGEFDNGKNSGWMYTVNGDHPQFGLKDFKVTNGDSIVWHYVDDYKLETSFNGSAPMYLNRWLEAEDKNPPTDGSVIDMSGAGKSDENAVLGAEIAKNNIDVVASVNNGVAVGKVDKDEITKAIEAVETAAGKKQLQKEIVLNMTGATGATSASMLIPKAAVNELDKKVDILTVDTPVGSASFDKKALGSLAAENGKELVIKLERKEKDEAGNASKLNVVAKIGEKEIKNLNGNARVALPYKLSEGQLKEAVVCYRLSENGEKTLIRNGAMNKSKDLFEVNLDKLGMLEFEYRNIAFNDTIAHWSNKNVIYLAARDLVKGKSDKSFEPNSNITRAEFVQLLANLSGVNLDNYSSVNRFSDVSENDWYAKNASWALERGITLGSGNGKFSPRDNITRQDMAVMILRYVELVEKGELKAVNSEVNFLDGSKIANYAKPAVSKMQQAGIINGMKNENGSVIFKPTANATRGEAVTMIANYLR